MFCLLLADEENGATGGDWNNTRSQNQGGKGLWDDAAGTSGGTEGGSLDLEDFAAMALKFRTEMEEMKLNGGDGSDNRQEEDTMEAMFRDQQRRLGQQGSGGGLEDDEDEALPDWADDDVAAAPTPAAQQPAAKRSLLLEVSVTVKYSLFIFLVLTQLQDVVLKLLTCTMFNRR